MDDGATPAGVLDLAQLEEATGGEPELVQELTALYLSDASEQFGTLREAADSGDLERLYRVAHGLKGASASIGATEAAEAFRALEAAGRQGDAAAVPAALTAAEAALARVRQALASL